MQLQNDTLAPTKICFGIFLTDKFPLLPLSIMTDTLRIANTLEEKRNFSYVLISADGQSTSSSCEFPAPIEAGINNCPVLDVVLVCTGQGGTKTTNQGRPKLASQVKPIRRNHRWRQQWCFYIGRIRFIGWPRVRRALGKLPIS